MINVPLHIVHITFQDLKQWFLLNNWIGRERLQKSWMLQPFSQKFWVLQDEHTPRQLYTNTKFRRPCKYRYKLNGLSAFLSFDSCDGGLFREKKKTLRRVIHSQARNMWERSGLNKYLHLLPPKGLPFLPQIPSLLLRFFKRGRP